jgi:hypothetical protein
MAIGKPLLQILVIQPWISETAQNGTWRLSSGGADNLTTKGQRIERSKLTYGQQHVGPLQWHHCSHYLRTFIHFFVDLLFTRKYGITLCSPALKNAGPQ